MNQYYSCNFKATETLKEFKTSNYSHYYKLKHPIFAYNEQSEKIR